ncbi:MAG TPA: NADPH-dependent oxidoreductase [Chthoniobacterales bacterium]
MPEINALLYARYGEAAPQTLQPPANDVIATLLNHRSVRAYLPDALDPGVLELLISVAQSASTSSNLQAWSVVAVEEKDHKARLAAHCGNQKHILEAPLFLAWIVDLARLRRVAQNAGSSSDGLDFLETFLIGVIDAALAAQNVVAAAESLGLGTVYIGALRNHPEKVAAELRLPTETFPIFGLIVGKPDPTRPSAIKPRLPQPAVLHREYYQVEPQDDAVALYDEIIGAFYAEQKLPQQQWTRHTANRIKAAESLGSRVRLREAISNLGFQIP